MSFRNGMAAASNSSVRGLCEKNILVGYPGTPSVYSRRSNFSRNARILAAAQRRTNNLREHFRKHPCGSPLFMERRPVLVGLIEVLRDVLRPGLFHALAVVQVQLPVPDRPGFGVDRRGVVLADSVGAIPAELRRVLLGRFGELVAMLGAGELPRRAIPLMGEARRALHGFAVREVRDRVVALDGDTARVLVDRVCGGSRERRQNRNSNSEKKTSGDLHDS